MRMAIAIPPCSVVVVAKILEVNDHPNADKLYLIKVDLGEEQRQVVAGIRSAYAKEDLVGKQVVLVSNLQPATIRGEESNGMVLAVSDDQGISLIRTERDVVLGSRIK